MSMVSVRLSAYTEYCVLITRVMQPRTYLDVGELRRGEGNEPRIGCRCERLPAYNDPHDTDMLKS